MLLKRRQLAGALLCTAAGGATAFYVHAPAVAAGTADAPARRLSVQACKFDFAPKEIRVTKGERVTIVLTSPDFVHGFSVPDFNVRSDGIPGKTIEVTFIADKSGKFIYLCDNFCGEHHDKMTGWLIVTET